MFDEQKKARKKKKLDPEERLQSLAAQDESSDAPAVDPVLQKADEILFYLNLVKNGMTVQTGEFEALTRIFTGQKMYVDIRDVSLAPHLMLDGMWEPETTTLFQRIIRADDVVFDIGANFGYYSLLAATLIKPEPGETSLHMFEANPELVPLLEKSISVNGMDNYTKLNNVAVAEKKGKAKLNVARRLWGGSTIHTVKERREYQDIKDVFDRSYEVEMITIDDYCKQNKIDRVTFMKIDVEGVEDRVYVGMRETVKNNPDLRLLIEFTFDAYKDEKGYFKQLGDDFAYMYLVKPDGSLEEVDRDKGLTKMNNHEFSMLLLSHDPVPA